jgi:hypothetical protein
MHRRLNGGSADPSEGGDLLDWKITNSVLLDLERHDAQNGALSLRVMAPDVVWHGA